MAIYSCMGCVAPKRHPGCHDSCPQYLEEKAKHDAEKEAEEKKKSIERGIDSQRAKAIYLAKKIRHWRRMT